MNLWNVLVFYAVIYLLVQRVCTVKIPKFLLWVTTEILIDSKYKKSTSDAQMLNWTDWTLVTARSEILTQNLNKLNDLMNFLMILLKCFLNWSGSTVAEGWLRTRLCKLKISKNTKFHFFIKFEANFWNIDKHFNIMQSFSDLNWMKKNISAFSY